MAQSGTIKAMILDAAAEAHASTLASRFPAVRFHPCSSYDDVAPTLAEWRPEAVLTFKIPGKPYPRASLLEAPTVKWIHVGGAGVDHFLPWDPKRVRITNSSGIHGDIMAQYVLCAVLMVNQRFPTYSRQQRDRHWLKHRSISIEGQTLTVIGFGHVGSAIGDLAKRAGMRVIGVRNRPEPSDAAHEVVGTDRLHWAVADADHVVVILPLAEATRGSIDASVIAALKPGAHLINVSRGGIVDEAALGAALASGALGALTLDVFATEPLPEDSPFWGAENVVLTPHSSSDIERWESRVVDLFARNLENWLADRPLINLVDPARGY